MKNTNLLRAMQCFHLTDTALAAAINIDRAQINRWKNGVRPLYWNSWHVARISDFFLESPYYEGRVRLLEMLEKEGGWDREESSLPQVLATWLSCAVPQKKPEIAEMLHAVCQMQQVSAPWPKQDAQLHLAPFESIELETLFQHLIYSLKANPEQELLLSVRFNDLELLSGPHFARFWQYFLCDPSIRTRIILQKSRNKADLNRLLAKWVPLLSKGGVQLLCSKNIRALTQSTFALTGEDAVFCLFCPTPESTPQCLCIQAAEEAKRIRQHVEQACNDARPLLTMLHDNDLEQAEAFFFDEFALDGGWDIFKSGINTMFLAPQDFCALLMRKGSPPEEARYRAGKFEQFQNVMRARLQTDRARELLSKSTIEEMVSQGSYDMPGVYFDLHGIVTLDRQAIGDICKGYCSFLRNDDLFEVRLSENTPQFLDKLCWHIKTNRHVLIQTWAGTEAISVYIDNPQLMAEFANHFDIAWQAEPEPAREAVIAQFEAWERQCREL